MVPQMALEAFYAREVILWLCVYVCACMHAYVYIALTPEQASWNSSILTQISGLSF